MSDHIIAVEVHLRTAEGRLIADEAFLPPPDDAVNLSNEVRGAILAAGSLVIAGAKEKGLL